MFRHLLIGIVALGTASWAVAQDRDGTTNQPSQPGRITIQPDQDDTTGRTPTDRQRTGDRNGMSGQGLGRMDASDRAQQPDAQQVVEHLASGNQFEIELSRLAEQKSQDPQVKQFAQRMMQEHTQALQQLRQVAERKNLDFKAELNDAQQAKLKELSQKDGADFDRAFSICQAGLHVEAVLMHQYLANEYEDQQIQQMARQMLPKLQQHRQQALQVAQAQVGLPGGAVPAGSRLDDGNLDRSNQPDMDQTDMPRQPNRTDRMPRSGQDNRTGTGSGMGEGDNGMNNDR